MAGLLIGSAVLSTQPISGQTNLNFNGVTVTGESAIRLSWNSTSNEVYRIEYANEVVDVNVGSTTWLPLYDNYPSHGTNTFWLDTGNRYIGGTKVPHPKNNPMRFYRITNKGTNDGVPPYIVITSPTNNAVLSDVITVSVVSTSSMPVINIRLFVDGQEMKQSEDGTNFVINTCEWLNGPHTLFATAKAQSSFSGPSGSFPIAIGRAVSPNKTVTFSNLISGVAFSQDFYEPSLGQTQQVTAKFAANVNWTLQIANDDSNVVRTVTGSGTSLTFDWDGTGDGGTNIADGVYYYYISAATNGLSSLMGGGEEELFFSNLMMTEEGDFLPTTAKQAMALGMDSYFVKMPPLPPIRVNGEWVHSEPETREVSIPSGGLSMNSSIMSFSGGGSQAAAVSSPQSTKTPTRVPTSPVKNAVNNFGIGYYSFPNGKTTLNPRNLTTPGSSVIHLDGGSGNASISDKLPEADHTAINTLNKFTDLGWKMEFQNNDDWLSLNSMKRSDLGIGGGQVFTTATIGLFMSHGSYGAEPDFFPGSSGSKQIYFPSSNPSDGTSAAAWLRLCQFGFGGNLKWMAILACNSICDPNYQDMVNKGAIPLKDTHLLCGTATIAWM